MGDYERGLLIHMQHHNVKQWLLDGCEREDARTIMAAIESMPEHRLVRRLARMLSQEGEEEIARRRSVEKR